ncbi:hypothetical protein D4A39_08295 [Alcanivorax profundi]|uniref:Uncharacterized protein n=2 Tax=Alcanivorax profundi TaxID=2338368 RepID=A0A418XZL0_9GAMM|nr:hypothetical protein D4A39_08295 [Alcanivorax profundi]
MVVEFKMSFILDNEEFFEYGSPVDIGGLSAGYIGLENYKASDLKVNFFDFDKIISEISAVRFYERQKFLEHEITESVYGILKSNFNNDLADFIRFDENPHSRLFEFCLAGGYKINEDHVQKIHIPNTYKNSLLMKRISDRFKGRVLTFNPKYGFESRNVG